MPLPPALLDTYSIKAPAGRNKRDFYEFIQKAAEFSRLRVEGGFIKLGLINKYFLFEMNGSWYGMNFLAMFGQVSITIEEITEKNDRQWRDLSPKKLTTLFVATFLRLLF